MYKYEFKESDIFDFARHVGIRTRVHPNEIQFHICPYCKGGKNGKDGGTFSINRNTGLFKCLRASCGQQGNMWRLAKDFDYHISTEFTRYIEKKPTFKKLQQPKEKIIPQPKAIEYLKKRGISEETAKAYQITSHKDKENVLVFPFFNTNGELVNIKYRDTEFVKGQSKGCKEWFETGCEPYLYGVNTFNGDYKTCVITEGQCFRGDAEILTPDGWIKLRDYSGQKVMQVNPDMTGKFVKPKAFITKRHIGKMVDVSIGGNYYSSTTDDHNIVFVNNKSNSIIKVKAADEIPVPNHHNIPTCIKFNATENGITNEELSLMLAISADGSIDVRKNGTYNYVRFGLTKQRKVDRLVEILEKLGYEYSDNVLISSGNKPYHSICFSCRPELTVKFLPWWLVSETTLEQKKHLIEEMSLWDGNKVKTRKQYEYSSIYKHNAEIIQAIASTCGYMSTIMFRDSGGNGDFKKGYIYKVSVLLDKDHVSAQRFEKNRKIYYDDTPVFCVTVDSGMILVRQNECISVSGNCDALACYEAGVENCFSVPGGKNSFTWYPACYEFLDKFEQVVVFGDYEHGEITLLKELQTRLDCRVKHIRKSDYKDCKDANDILLKYGKEYLKQIIDNAIDVPVKKVISLADVEDVDIFKLDKLKTGIKMVDKLLYGGLYFGGVTIITGKPGEGKSSLASQILVNAIDQGYKCFAYSGELPNFLFKNWMVFQTAGSKHIVENANPYGDMSYGISNINKSLITEWYRDKIWLYDNNSLDDGAESESLIKIITNVIKAYGVRVILLDNLMTAIDLAVEEGTDKYERQSNFVKKLTRIALKFNVLILLVAHKRKNNFSTNENDEVGGSSDIVNLAAFAISYAKDKDLKDSERMLRVTKNRLFGRVELSGYPLGFEPKSKRIYGVGDDVNVVYGWDKKFEEEQVEFETPFD